MGSHHSKDIQNIGRNENTENYEQINRYLWDSEDLRSYNIEEPILVKPEPGYRVEVGSLLPLSEINILLEEQDKHSLFYNNNFYIFEHYNYVGGTDIFPFVISIMRKDRSKSGGYNYLALIRTKVDNIILRPIASSRKKALKYIMNNVNGLKDIKRLPCLVANPSILNELKFMEEKFFINSYRVGVIYAGISTDEDDMFGQKVASVEFLRFMKWLGKRIRLKNWKGFRGGLDVKDNTTGKHSYFTQYKGFSIMFHVSTELPYSDLNSQQIERKRYIGNDIVVIIFFDAPPEEPFYPKKITSKFNQVYIVIQAVKKDNSGGLNKKSHESNEKNKNENSNSSSRKNRGSNALNSSDDNSNLNKKSNGYLKDVKYKLSVVSKQGVHPHGPPLPKNHLWELNDQFRDFILTKMINMERAAYYAPGFAQSRTRRLWLKQIVENYGEKN